MEPLKHTRFANLVKQAVTRTFFPLRRRPFEISPGSIMPQDELVDEEVFPGYNSKNFYPAKPGEVLANRYQILVKVGWGVSSTIWFARDMRGYRWEPESLVALKIANINQHAADEQEIEDYIAHKNPDSRGIALLRTHSDHFEIVGPEGKHLCLAYEPMREPFWLFQRRFKDRVIPLPIIKTYILFFLTRLDYLHAECKVAHTDLKLENIMVSFEDPAVFGDFMNSQLEQSMQYKVDSAGRSVYRCHNQFGPLRSVKGIIPKIVDFGASVTLESEDNVCAHPIQPDHYRAPEVILGCGWKTSADIWNFGVILWNLIQGKDIFQQTHDSQGRYDAKSHLAEMIALLGPPPSDLVTRSRYTWPEPLRREDGKLCENAEQYFEGPFFDEDGKFLFNDLIPHRKLEDTLPSLEDNEKEKFLSFARLMLAWLPEERKTARELLDHPFLRIK